MPFLKVAHGVVRNPMPGKATPGSKHVLLVEILTGKRFPDFTAMREWGGVTQKADSVKISNA